MRILETSNKILFLHKEFEYPTFASLTREKDHVVLNVRETGRYGHYLGTPPEEEEHPLIEKVLKLIFQKRFVPAEREGREG